jgi:Uma2 family endonuclease
MNRDFDLSLEPIRPLRRAEYDRLVELGVFEDERVELLHGGLVQKCPQSELHAKAISHLNKLFVVAVGERAEVRIQAPFAATHDSEPEPDVAIVPLEQPSAEHPTTALLVIEVADTSIRKDRSKALIYAAAGVPEYWIVNLTNRMIEVHRDLVTGGYASRTLERAGKILHPKTFPDVAVPTAELFPRT